MVTLTSRLLFTGLMLMLCGCSGLLFQPQKQLVRSPSDVGLDYENVDLIAADGINLHGWLLKPKGELKGSVYFLHGNAENISTHIASVWWLPAAGYQVLLIDYRGFGLSQGVPSIPSVFMDIEAGFEWLRRQPGTRDRPIYMFGQSLGAALGAYTAATDKAMIDDLDGVVLESSFTRYRTITREVTSRYWLTWAFQWPAAWSMPRQYDPVDYIGGISPRRLLLIHGTQDIVVPFRHAEELQAAAGQPNWLLRFEGPHIGAMLDPRFRQIMLDFMAGQTPRLPD
jgi:fermentation-respiration switch protein FrsA (DUF1100 family)